MRRATQHSLCQIQTSARQGTAWQVLAIFVIGLWLDAFVDLPNCEYDACRYVKLTHIEYIAIFNAELFSSTTVMHFLYGGLALEGMPFVRVAIFHAVVLCLVVWIFDVRNPIIRSPLFIALLAIPGKEFYLLIATLLIFPDDGGAKSRRSWFWRLMFASLLISLSRFAYLPLFVLAYVLAYSYRCKGKASFFWLAILSLLTLSILMSGVGFHEAVRDIADQEATVEGVNALRDVTFGFSIDANILRFFAYVGYLAMLPVAEIVRALEEVSMGNFYPAQPFLWAALFEWFIYVFSRSRHLVLVIVVVSGLLVALVFPFVHTRYLLPLVLFIQAYAYGRSSSQPFFIWRSR